MTPNQKREEISKAYIAAVAAKCGFKLGYWSQDDDCLDVTVGAAGPLGHGTLAGPKIDLQLKCSNNPIHDKDVHIAHQLSYSHYERLRAESCNPRILVFLMLPEREDEWIVHSMESLILRRCAYWISLQGFNEISGKTDSITIYIPKTNVFSPDTLFSLMEKVSCGEEI